MDNAREPFQTAADYEDAHGQLLEALGADESVIHAHLRPQIEIFAKRGAAGGAYLFDVGERRACQAMLDFWATQSYSGGFDIGRPRLDKPNPSLRPELEDSKCPYVGLRAFGEEDRKRYFGREDETGQLVAKVSRERLVVVTGASGSGKSSLVLAGLLPRLKEDAIDGSAHWRYLSPTLPGKDPLRRLVACLMPEGSAPTPSVDSEARALLKDPKHLAHLLERFTQPTVLIVDQFEEVFTLQTPETKPAYEAFVANLLEAANTPSPQHRIVLTMRKNVEPKLALYPELHERYAEAAFLVFEMAQRGLRAAIEEPAAAIGLKFQRGVVDEIVASMIGEENNPPLLQFALTQLWRRRAGNLITHDALRQLGNVKQAIPEAADALYKDLKPEEQRAADRVFLKLAREGDGAVVYRDRVSRKDLLALADENNVSSVLHKFAQANLLRITPTAAGQPGEDLIEVVHESLLRNWPHVDNLIAEQRSERERRAFLRRLADEWQTKKYDRGSLLGGLALKDAQETFGSRRDLSEIERKFLAASTKFEQDQRREWQIRFTMALVALAFVGFLLMQTRDARNDLEAKNLEFLSREVAAEAQKVGQRDPILGVLLAEAAFEKSPTPQALGALYGLTWLSQVRPKISLSREKVGELVGAIALNPDGSRLLTAGGGKIREWTLGPDPKLTATFEGLAGQPYLVENSSDGTRIAVLARGSETDKLDALYYWSAGANKSSPTKLDMPINYPTRLALNSNGSSLAAIGYDRGPERSGREASGSNSLPRHGFLAVWTLNALHPKPYVAKIPGRPVAVHLPTPETLEILFDSGELRRASIDANGRVGELVPVGKRCEPVTKSLYSLSRGVFLAFTPASYCLNRFAYNNKLEGQDASGEIGQAVLLSPDGTYVASLQRTSRSILVASISGNFERRLPGAFDLDDRVVDLDSSDYGGPVLESFIQLSNGGRRLAAKRSDGSVSIYDLDQGSPWPSGRRNDEFAPDGRHYATLIVAEESVSASRQSAPEARLEIREWPSKKVIAEAKGPYNPSFDAPRFTGNGRYVVVSDDFSTSATIVLDLNNPGRPFTLRTESVTVGRSDVLVRLSDEKKGGGTFQLVSSGRTQHFRDPVVARTGELIADQVPSNSGLTFPLFRASNGQFEELGSVAVEETNAKVQFEATGRFVLIETASQNQPVTRVFALGERRPVQKGEFAGRYSSAVAHPDGKLISASRAPAIRAGSTTASVPRWVVTIMNLETGKLIDEEGSSISRNGRFLVRSAPGAEGVEVIDVGTLQRALSIPGTARIAFSPDDALLVAVYREGQLLTIYSLADRRAIAEIPIEGIYDAKFDASGANIVVETRSSKELVPVRIDSLRKIVRDLASARKLTDTERCEFLREKNACSAKALTPTAAQRSLE